MCVVSFTMWECVRRAGGASGKRTDLLDGRRESDGRSAASYADAHHARALPRTRRRSSYPHKAKAARPSALPRRCQLGRGLG